MLNNITNPLKTKAISGIRWTSISIIASNAIQLVQIIILSRFLSPAEFGLIAIIMVVINISQIFSDMGISNAIIHKQDITHNQLSSLYVLNIFAGVVMFVMIGSLAPLIAKFYNAPQLYMPLLLMAFSFVIQAFGTQFFSILQKNLRFKGIAIIEIISRLMGFFVSVFLVVNNFGIYAIVYGCLSSVAIQTLMLLFVGGRVYRPFFHFNMDDLKGYTNFGLFQIGEKIINYFSEQFDIILIGKLLGVETLGIYYIARQIIMKPLIIGAVQFRVSFPLLARVQDDIEMLKKVFLKAINYLSSIISPVCISIAILAEPLVLLFFGAKWREAILIIRILSFYAVLLSIGDPIASLFLARGRPDLGFYLKFVLLFYVPAWIFLGSRWGLSGIAFSLVLMQLSLLIPNWYFLINRICRVNLWEYHKQIFIPLVLSGVAGIFGLFFYLLFSNLLWLQLFSVLIVGFLVYSFLSFKYNQSFVLALKEMLWIGTSNQGVAVKT